MAAPYNPPVKSEDLVIRVALVSAADGKRFQVDPTIAAGDFKVDKDGAGLTSVTTLPTVDPSGSVLVKVALSSTEMNADVVTIVAKDQTDPPEWCDLVICIPTTSV